MKFQKMLLAAVVAPLALLQASDIPYYYDYGYPPPAGYLGSFGTVVIGAEWLYMKPAVDENYFAETTIFTPGGPGCITRSAPCLKWDSGFRVNLGYDLPCDQWALNVSYLYFWTKAASSDAFTNSFPGINPGQTVTLGGGINPVLFDSVAKFANGSYTTNGQWKWQYNQLDVDFSRATMINRSVCLTPRAGFRFLWSEQQLNTAFDFESSSSVNSQTVGTHNKTNIDAFGIKFGVDSTWDIGFCGLSLYGNFDYSVLLSCVRLRQDLDLTETISMTTLAPVTQSLTFKSNPKSLKQMATLAFGLQWLTDFNCDESFLVVKAGWEYIFLSGFNMLIAREARGFDLSSFLDGSAVLPVSHTLRGDMGLYGLVLGADYYF